MPIVQIERWIELRAVSHERTFCYIGSQTAIGGSLPVTFPDSDGDQQFRVSGQISVSSARLPKLQENTKPRLSVPSREATLSMAV
jgi:hypothetical protein